MIITSYQSFYSILRVLHVFILFLGLRQRTSIGEVEASAIDCKKLEMLVYTLFIIFCNTYNRLFIISANYLPAHYVSVKNLLYAIKYAELKL